MDFTIIPVIASLIFFVLGILQGTRKNGQGSVLQIGLYIAAAAFMYLGVSYTLIPAQPAVYSTSNIIITQSSGNTLIGGYNQILSTGTNPAPEDVYILESFAWIYIAICMVFCTAGVIGRLGE